MMTSYAMSGFSPSDNYCRAPYELQPLAQLSL
jgi:hypothetical protein